MPSHHHSPRPTSMLPKFADTTTTIIYCVHCRSCSSSASDCSDEAETPTHHMNTNTKTKTKTSNNLNRCSRCKVVHYCSKECQKLNYNFHKKRCKIIHKLRNEITEMKKNEEVGTEAEVEMEIEEEETSLRKRYELSYLIFELGYMSTDTIERGKYIYQCSLLEYYKLFQIDNFYFTGVLESILLLLSILGDRNYDKYCISLIKYVLYNNDDNNDNNNIYNNGEFLCWDYGDITTASSSTFEISDYKKFRNLLAIRHHNNTKNGMFNSNPNMNPNIFFVPLMIIKMRQYADMTRTRNDHDNQQSLLILKKEIAEICYEIEIEYETNNTNSTDNNTGDYNGTTEKLSVVKSLFPDSNQHWGNEEAQMLLATTTTTTKNNQNDNQNNEWAKCYFIYWMLIKDCYAYTPGLLDVVEEIIIYMEESKSTEDVIPNDIIGNNDNDPSSESESESDNDTNNRSVHDSEEYMSFINSMSSTAQEQQHKQQQQQQEEEEEEQVGL